MNKLSVIVFFALSTFVCLTLFSYTNALELKQETSNTTELQKIMPIEMVDILRHPDHVTAFRVGNEENVIRLNADQITDLQSILLNKDSYLKGMTKDAVFIPSVVLIFSKGESLAVLTVSFHAKQIEFFQDQSRYILDIDPVFTTLQNICLNIIN